VLAIEFSENQMEREMMGVVKDFKHCPECRELIEKGLTICPKCNCDIRPFIKTNTDSVEDKNHVTLRFNSEERAILDDIKTILDIRSDGTALKIAAFQGWAVLQRTLGRDYLKWLADKDRQSRGFK
jgi:hypothetical protein